MRTLIACSGDIDFNVSEQWLAKNTTLPSCELFDNYQPSDSDSVSCGSFDQPGICAHFDVCFQHRIADQCRQAIANLGGRGLFNSQEPIDIHHVSYSSFSQSR